MKNGIRLNNATAPCKGCTNRHVGCHGTCSAYIEFDKKNKERRKQNFQATENNVALSKIKSTGVRNAQNKYYCTGHSIYQKSNLSYRDKIREEVQKNAI